MGGVANTPWMCRSLLSPARSHQNGSYEGSPFTFVTDGLEGALEQAKAVAGDKDVGVGAASIVQQCIRAGLLDEIHLDLVPVLLGGGVSLFDTSAPGRSTWSA
jgi:dihydrofolate reductase